jgi:hypothetical protein
MPRDRAFFARLRAAQMRRAAERRKQRDPGAIRFDWTKAKALAEWWSGCWGVAVDLRPPVAPGAPWTVLVPDAAAPGGLAEVRTVAEAKPYYAVLMASRHQARRPGGPLVEHAPRVRVLTPEDDAQAQAQARDALDEVTRPVGGKAAR